MKRMKAVIMAGGEGTRLRPLTCNRPKPMVPVGNKPVMEHIVELLRKHHLNEVAVTLQYMPDLIREYFWRRFGIWNENKVLCGTISPGNRRKCKKRRGIPR